MSKKLSRQDTVESAVGALHKFSGVLGVNTESLHNKIRRSQSTDVEKGRPVREEAKQILESSLAKKSTEEEVEEGEVPSLNQHHVREILASLQAGQTKKQAPDACVAVCQLLIFIPLAVYLIYIGHKNLKNCPLARLPEWLMVFGIISLLRSLFQIFSCLSGVMESRTTLGLFASLDKLVAFVAAFWGLYGIYLMWGNWNDYTYEDATSPRYCVYLVMIWNKILIGFTIFGLILLGVVLCCICCCVGAAAAS